MIEVNIDETAQGYSFICEGETHYAPDGFDIINAGVSALCMALISSVKDQETEGELIIESNSIEPGKVELEVKIYPGNCEVASSLAVIKAVRRGLEVIQKQYPEYVKINSEI